MAQTVQNTPPADFIGDISMRDAIATQPLREVMLPSPAENEDPVLNVTVNGVGYAIVKGERVKVPECIAAVVDQYIANGKEVWAMKTTAASKAQV